MRWLRKEIHENQVQQTKILQHKLQKENDEKEMEGSQMNWKMFGSAIWYISLAFSLLLLVSIAVYPFVRADEFVINKDIPVTINIDQNNQLTITYDIDNQTIQGINTAASQNLSTSFTIENRDIVSNFTFTECDFQGHIDNITNIIQRQNCTTENLQNILSQELITEREYFVQDFQTKIIEPFADARELTERLSECKEKKAKCDAEDTQKTSQISQLRKQLETTSEDNKGLFILIYILIGICGILLLVIFTRGNLRMRLKMPGSDYN